VKEEQQQVFVVVSFLSAILCLQLLVSVCGCWHGSDVVCAVFGLTPKHFPPHKPVVVAVTVSSPNNNKMRVDIIGCAPIDDTILPPEGEGEM
jgi:hypothetical protein